MQTKLKYVALFVLSFTVGLVFFAGKNNDILSRRGPAALNSKVFQISTLTNEEIKQQLQNKFKVAPTIDGQKFISLAGFSSSICKTYSVIELELSAEGMSVAGEPPALKITYPCEAGQDPAEIASLRIPIDQLLKEKARNAEFKFDGYSATMTLANSADEWPRQWTVKRIEFKNSLGDNKQITFKRSPASVENDAPIVVEF